MDKKRMQNISNNITKYRKEKNLTQKELAEKIGIRPSTLSDYINLRSSPSHGVIQKLADLFGVQKSDIDNSYKDYDSISYIYNQLDSNRKKNVYSYAENQLKEQNTTVEDLPVPYDYTDVVLNGYVAAGTGNYVDDVEEPVRIPTSYLPKANYDVMVKVNGDSMEPAFLDGDYIFIKRVAEFPNGKFAVVIVNNEAFLKKVYKEDNRLRLVSLNSKYNDMYFDETDDIQIVGTVVN